MAGSTIGGSGRRKGANHWKRAWWAATSVRTPPFRKRDGSVRVYTGFAAASGQRSRMRPRSMYSGTNTRVRHETISVVQPMRLSAARSRSAGPSIFDPAGAHQAPPCEAPAIGEIEGRAAVQDRLVDLGRTHDRSAGQPEGVAEGVRLLGRQNPAEQAFPGVGREPAHPHVLARQPVPDGEQQAGDQPQAGFGVAGQPFNFRIPQRAPAIPVRILPVRGGKLLRGHGLAGGGDEPGGPGPRPRRPRTSATVRAGPRRRASSGC